MQKKSQNKPPVHKLSNENGTLQKTKSKTLNQSDASKFTKFQIVWAKITGYPWWPAIITSVPEEKDNSYIEQDFKNGRYFSNINTNTALGYRVDFIADQTHAYLKKNFLLKYKQNRQKLSVDGLQFSRRKRKYFQMAINEADQIFQVLQISKDQANKNSLNSKQEQPQSSSSQQSQPQQSENSSSCQQQQIQIKKYLVSQKHLEIFEKEKSKKNLQKLNSDQNQDKQEQCQLLTTIKKRRGRPMKKVRNNLNNLNEKKSKKSLSEILLQDKVEVQFNQQKQMISQQDQEQLIKISEQSQKDESNSLGEKMQFKRNRTQVRTDLDRNLKGQKEQGKQFMMQQLLNKYKLNLVDELQQQHRLKVNQMNKLEQSFILNNQQSLQNRKINGSRSMTFIKNVLSLTNRNKVGRRNCAIRKLSNNEESQFGQKMSLLSKLKDSQYQKISLNQQRFLVKSSLNKTARKIYKVVGSILTKNRITMKNQQNLEDVRIRCLNIANLLFDQSEFQRTNNDNKVSTSTNNKKRPDSFPDNMNFITVFKRKLQECMTFLRFYCLQNWQLVTKSNKCSVQLCVQLRSFQQYLQKQLNLSLKNQESLEYIVKQISIQNQKTAFQCVHINSQMQNQHPSVDTSSNRFSIQKVQEPHNDCTNPQKQEIRKIVNSRNQTIRSNTNIN